MIKVLRQILLLPRFAVVEHQAETVALVSRTLLGAVGDVAAIGRIERRRVAGGIVGGDVLRDGAGGRGVRRSIYRDDPQIVVGGRGGILVVIRGVANLLPVGRVGVVILPAEGEHRRVVVARSEIAGNIRNKVAERSSEWWHLDDEDVAALAFFVSIPVPIEQE